MRFELELAEKGMLPDFLIKYGIKKLLKKRLYEISKYSEKKNNDIISELKTAPVAIETNKANKQHYELPTDFFTTVLGEKLKYSSCYFKNQKDTLDTAENNMLDLYIKRAELSDNMSILDLGCGWGSLSFHIANKFPGAKITALSNSRSQKEYIEKKARDMKIKNIEVITEDISIFDFKKKQL